VPYASIPALPSRAPRPPLTAAAIGWWSGGTEEPSPAANAHYLGSLPGSSGVPGRFVALIPTVSEKATGSLIRRVRSSPSVMRWRNRDLHRTDDLAHGCLLAESVNLTPWRVPEPARADPGGWFALLTNGGTKIDSWLKTPAQEQTDGCPERALQEFRDRTSTGNSTDPPCRYLGLVAPAIAAAAASPRATGLWLAGPDGSLVTMGAAANAGSFSCRLGRPRGTGWPRRPGYWKAGGDGGILSFGNARLLGIIPALHLVPNAPIAAIAAD
jgi:hypothetical protein